MTEIDNEIKLLITGLAGAVGRQDEGAISEALGSLAMVAFMDLRRIANGVEKLSNFKLERIGDLAFVGDGVGMAAYAGASLTEEEWKTIEALRTGDIRVVLNSQPDERERRAIQLYRDHVARERERGVKLDMIPWAQLPEPAKNLWRQEAELDPGKGVET